MRFNEGKKSGYGALAGKLIMLAGCFGAKLKDLIFPVECLGCGAEGVFLCEVCLKKCLGNAEKYRPVIADKSGQIDFLIAAFDYEKSRLIRDCIHGLKYEFIKELGAPLGLVLKQAYEKIHVDKLVVCPVPLSRARLRWRGFNQAELLAKAFSRLTGLPVMDLLIRKSFSKPQMELSRESRIKNVEGVFGLNLLFKKEHGAECLPEKILLIDDVYTTGSTLNECAKVLKAAGAMTVGALVLAKVN